MATPVTPVKSTHSSQHQPTTTPHAPRNLVALTQQNQDLTSSREALCNDTCDVDVIPSGQLIEAIYGKVGDIDGIRKRLEQGQLLSNRGWKALYNSTKNSYQPSDSPLEEDKAFAGLAAIFEQCLHAAEIPNTRCLVNLKVHGHQNMAAESSDETRPDATIQHPSTMDSWQT
jgi:hypothetical protein